MVRAALDGVGRRRSCNFLHRSLRDFGKPTSLGILDMAAEVPFAEAFTLRAASDETICQDLHLLRVDRQPTQTGITNPHPPNGVKWDSQPADSPDGGTPRRGAGLAGQGLVVSPGLTGLARLVARRYGPAE